MNQITGLSTDEALTRLYRCIQKVLDKRQQELQASKIDLQKQLNQNDCDHPDPSDKLLEDGLSQVRNSNKMTCKEKLGRLFGHSAELSSGTYCVIYMLFSILYLVLMCLCVALEELSAENVICCVILLLIAAMNVSLTILVNSAKRRELERKAQSICDHIKQLASESEDPLQCVELYAPQSECIHMQWTYRDGQLVNLPWILLVEGDTVLLRPGRESPARCRQITDDESQVAITFAPGELFVPEEVHKLATVTAVHPLQSLLCQVVQAPAECYVDTCLRSSPRPPTLLSRELYRVLHVFNERLVIPIFFAISLVIGLIRLIRWQSAKSETAELLLLRPALIVMTLLMPAAPFFLHLLMSYTAAKIHSSICSSDTLTQDPGMELFSETEHRVTFSAVLRSWWRQLLGDPQHLFYSANLMETLGTVSSVSVVDKKGILSWANPAPEKVFFLRNAAGDKRRISDTLKQMGVSQAMSDAAQSNVVPEVLDLTQRPDQAFAARFDDPKWKRFLKHLKPIGLNMSLNSCDATAEYTRFLDHVHVISEQVPRTIAVVNRRCCCRLSALLGFQADSIACHVQNEGIVAAYKKVAGEMPLPGLVKHRTPMENIFATVCREVKSERRQLMCQGTARLLVDTCSHAWTGDSVEPLGKNQMRKLVDFYHRYSMTSYCVGFSFKIVNGVVNPDANQFYVDWPLTSKEQMSEPCSKQHVNTCDARSLNSYEAANVQITTAESEEPEQDADACLQSTLTDCIFLGMLSLQYQAKPDVVRLIEHLDKPCVRFVHFSKENELRSRIFAEKMGLEAGWNCHISLVSEGSLKHDVRRPRLFAHGDHVLPSSAAARKRYARSKSLPNNWTISNCIVEQMRKKRSDHKQKMRQLLVIEQQEEMAEAPIADSISVEMSDESSSSASESDADKNSCSNVSASATPRKGSDTWSSCGEPTAAVSARYVMPNSAKLPTGIECVRPHLENVDNVPLLVSLFTDCEHASTRDMLHIMQDYGEVVLIVGSTLNYHNADIFCQANCSLAIEPLQPAICLRSSALPNAPSVQHQQRSATTLANRIASLPASLCVQSGQKLHLLPVLALSRHKLALMRHALLFLFSAHLLLATLQVASLALFLPLPFSLPQLLLWICISLPALTAALCSTPHNLNTSLSLTTAKNHNWLPKKNVLLFLKGLLAKFLPSCIAVLLLFWLLHVLMCRQKSDLNCWFKTNVTFNITQVDNYQTELAISRHICSFFTIIYLCSISAGYVYYRENLWAASPLKSVSWVLTCVFVIVLQVLYAAVNNCFSHSKEYFVPWYVYTAAILWLVPLFAISEIFKRWEIQLYKRDQRRRRLSFGTKLGLNSPF